MKINNIATNIKINNYRAKKLKYHKNKKGL